MTTRTIGVLTSGGDAPGMNACVRAVVRAAAYHGVRVFGITHGYAGLIEGRVEELSSRSVSNIIQRGGTVLKTARSEAFRSPEGRKTAADNLRRHGIDTLIAIGGDGTFRGAEALSREHGVNVIGVPGTIDNDIYGTDLTIGFDTAVNTALDAIDKIRDTAASHERLFLVEVMGRHSGAIAFAVAIGGGAEAVMVPEEREDFERIAEMLVEGRKRGKKSTLVIVAEGEEHGGAFQIAARLKDLTGIDSRVCVLGHVQRGGSPTAVDRVLASRLGVAAVEAALQGVSSVMVGVQAGNVVHVPLSEVVSRRKGKDTELLRIAEILSV